MMRRSDVVFAVLVLLAASSFSQNPPATPPDPNAPATQADIKSLQDALKPEDPDFGLNLGVGSLILNSGVTDYSNKSNVLQANNLGRATPQYLVGVSMRTHLPNFGHLGGTLKPSPKSKAANVVDCSNTETAKNEPKCDLWRRRPWQAFISFKFSPQSSQTINGYTFGGSYAIARYLDVLIGYALSPINEPAPGFRVTASQFVTEQQKNGAYLNFDPAAMARNAPDAFDGFPLTDASGKLIYPGDPLTVHYRGGAVFGLSLPIPFSSAFKGAK